MPVQECILVQLFTCSGTESFSYITGVAYDQVSA